MTLSALIRRSLRVIARYSSLSPSIGGLWRSLLDGVNVSALLLGLRGTDVFKDWAGCGADVVLLRVFEPCEDIPLGRVGSGLDPV